MAFNIHDSAAMDALHARKERLRAMIYRRAVDAYWRACGASERAPATAKLDMCHMHNAMVSFDSGCPWREFSPDGAVSPPVDVVAHNAALEAGELAWWKTRPDRAVVYIDDSETVTTWRGTPMGRIVRRRTYRNNFGARITSVTVRGTNGATYHGRFGSDWSQACRIHKSKGAGL